MKTSKDTVAQSPNGGESSHFHKLFTMLVGYFQNWKDYLKVLFIMASFRNMNTTMKKLCAPLKKKATVGRTRRVLHFYFREEGERAVFLIYFFVFSPFSRFCAINLNCFFQSVSLLFFLTQENI